MSDDTEPEVEEYLEDPDDLNDFTQTLQTLLTYEEVEDIEEEELLLSVDASTNWKSEMEIVSSIYEESILEQSQESGNRFFVMRFRAALYRDQQERRIAKLTAQLADLDGKIVSQEQSECWLKKKQRQEDLVKVRKKLKELRTQRVHYEKAIVREKGRVDYPELRVRFRLTRRYPKVPLDIVIENRGKLDGPQVSEIYRVTSQAMKKELGTSMICLVIDVIQKQYDEYLPKELDELVRLEREHQEEMKKINMSLRAEYDVDLSNPGQYVGNLNPLLRKLSREVKVINVENILRGDLVYKFERYRDYLRRKYLEGERNRHRRTTCDWAEIEVAFHGTRAENVGSIVTKGLIVPDRKNVRVASGSRYGLGIYTSPDINFSLHYTRGTGRLLVCAVLPGHKFICNDHNVEYGQGCVKGYDSHQSEDRTELVLFKASQVLPCYVIHYKYTPHMREKPRSEATSSVRYHEDAVLNHKLKKKKEREEMKMLAMKQLGYGFGPAGSKFVVEKVYGPREVEEEFGTYQNTHEHQYQKDRGIW